MIQFYIDTLKQFKDFDSRTGRRDYWVFTLMTLVISLLLVFIDASLGLQGAFGRAGLLCTLFNLLVFIPSLAIAVRRLHDIGRSGWWMLIPLVPVFGIFILIIFLLMPTVPAENDYGPASTV